MSKNDDLLGDTKPKKAKVKATKPAAKAATAKVKAKAAPAKATARTKLGEDAKLKSGKTEANGMMGIVQKAFGAGTTVKTGIERLRKTLKQPRGKAAKTDSDGFIRGYISGAVRKGVLTVI
jgi:hypothetical protein